MRTNRGYMAAALAVAVGSAGTAYGDRVLYHIEEDTVWDTNQALGDNSIHVAHAENDPLLTITNGAIITEARHIMMGDDNIDNSTGRMLIEQGSSLSNTHTVRLGRDNSTSAGSVTVSGEGSQWTVGQYMWLGHDGDGTVVVEDGGELSIAQYVWAGIFSTSAGRLTVTGADSQMNVGEAISFGVIGGSNATGTVTEGGTLYATEGVSVGGRDASDEGTGGLTVASGGVVQVDPGQTVSVWDSGSLGGAGGTIEGDVTNEGLIAPAMSFHVDENRDFQETLGSPGTLTINGSLSQETIGSELRLHIAGAGDYAALDVSGGMNLGGVLNIEAIGDPELSDGDTFNLLNGSLSGSFDQVNLFSLGDGLEWDASDLETQGTLSVIPEPGSLALLGFGGLMLLRCRRQ